MDETSKALSRIAAALERIAPAPPSPDELSRGSTLAWRPGAGGLIPAAAEPAPLDMLFGMEAQKAALVANTRRFASGASANHALLWGARGVGKSALVKAAHADGRSLNPELRLIEVRQQDLARLPDLLAMLTTAQARAILFMDDLSFDGGEETLRGLKPALEGGLGAAPANVIVYATSNRRQLVARDLEGEQAGPLGRDLMEERLALSDRFGLSLGFQSMDQELYVQIAQAYARALGLATPPEEVRAQAIRWALQRGARSGRTAHQFALHLAGEMGIKPAAAVPTADPQGSPTAATGSEAGSRRRRRSPDPA